MPPPSSYSLPDQSRVDLAGLKSRIAKRLGPERARRYFSCLNRFLSTKLSKPEFDQLCLLTLGGDNLPLHNSLIRSILDNAFHAKVPPPLPALANKFKQPSQWNCRPTGVRKIKDIPNSLRSKDAVACEDGDLPPYDFKRPVQNKSQRNKEKQSARHDRVSLHSNDHVEVVASEEDMECAKHRDVLNSARSPLRAPLGIPFCRASTGGAQHSLSLPTNSSINAGNHDNGELCHAEALRKQMETIAELHGLGAVSIDCANLLNSGVDAYLKRLIRACVDLARARSGDELIEKPVQEQHSDREPTDGVWLGNHVHVQSNGGSLEATPRPRRPSMISLQDFRAAMELNPRQLGEDWPLLLEKICLSSFEE